MRHPLASRGRRKQDPSPPIHERRADLAPGFVLELAHDRLPGHQGFDDSDPVPLRIDDRLRQHRHRADLPDGERFARVAHPVARGLEALAKLEIHLR
jgi:hypothetical protein